MSTAIGIPFTQYLRPDGRRREIWIHHEENVEAAARELIAAGMAFEAEVLNTGEVSLTLTDGYDEDLAIELCANGDEVSNAFVRLVRSGLELKRKNVGPEEQRLDDPTDWDGGFAENH